MTFPFVARSQRVAEYLASGIAALTPPPKLHQFQDHMVTTLRDRADGKQS